MLFGIYKDAGDTDAVLELKEGVTNERILSIFANYSVDAPTLSIKGGTYKSNVKLTISAKKGIEIYYTLDGSDPKENGTRYKSTIEIKGLGMHTVKVVTKNELGVYSNVVTETYIIQYDAPADPVVTPNGGTFDKKNAYIYISVPSGCSAYYTWDRTDPTAESEKYITSEIINQESIKVFPAHSILFVGIASVGKIGYCNRKCYSNQQITAIKPKHISASKYIAYALLASMEHTKSNALYTTVPIINNAYLGTVKIPYPTTTEQYEIVCFLDMECQKIDEIIESKISHCKILQQHKRSLIYEYVTGKKRVTEVK
jgi:hypothetical protein